VSAAAGSLLGGEVWVISPGGRDSTGGICRMVDYAAAEWERSGRAPAMRVIDSGGMAAGAAMLGRCGGALLAVGAGCLRGRVGVLHVHVAANGSVARKALFVLLGRAFRRPVVLHMHGADFEEFHARLPALGRWGVNAVFRAASAVVALGSRPRAHALAALGVDQRRLHVLANAVPDAPPVERRGEGICRLLFLGALTERKGLAELLAALATPSVAGLAWRLDVVGDGAVDGWRERADRLGLSERIRFHGWAPSEAARAMLGASDVLVLPSRQEGLPMAILEAMAAEVAVVATDVGAVADAVVDGQTGALVPARDVDALAGALSRVIASPEQRARLARAGRARFEADFTIDGYGARLAALFACAAGATRTDRSAPFIKARQVR
jgi:glycosyltransferase involved in cell wall biosynthesis